MEYSRSDQSKDKEFEERVVAIDRVSRTVKGGKRMRFRALVVVGNSNGRVGMGVGKAGDVQGSIKKAVTQAKKHLINVPIVNETIPHETTSKYGGATVFLKPAPAGTSIIAGGPVRAVIELAGIRNILSKIIGSTNKINNVRATLATLATLQMSDKQIKTVAAAKAAKAEAAKPLTVAHITPDSAPTPAKASKTPTSTADVATINPEPAADVAKA